jgi:putative heme-binding domain-containing protein
MMEELGHIVAIAVPSAKLGALLKEILASKDPASLSWQMAAVSGFADGLRARNSTAGDHLTVKGLSAGDTSDLRQKLDNLFKHSGEIAVDANATMSARTAAIGLLGQAEYSTAGQMLESLVGPQQPPELQTAAVRALGQMPDAIAGSALVTRERWNGYTPAVRDAVLSAFMANTNFLQSLFAAIEKGDVAPRTVNGDRRSQLMKSKDETIKSRAIALFKNMTPGDRMKVYEESKDVLSLKPDAKNGHAVFQKNCIPCHVVSGEGKVVGPDLTGIRNQPSEVLLLHIVVPEYEIMPIYTCYNVDTKDGQSYTGLLAAETPTTITLRMAQAIEQKIPRDQIASMVTSRLSLMPQELEKAMSKQDLADLIGFLKGD